MGFGLVVVLQHWLNQNLFQKPWQFEKSFLGGHCKTAVAELWDHCLQLDEWKSHPAFHGVSQNDRHRRGRSQMFEIPMVGSSLLGA